VGVSKPNIQALDFSHPYFEAWMFPYFMWSHWMFPDLMLSLWMFPHLMLSHWMFPYLILRHWTFPHLMSRHCIFPYLMLISIRDVENPTVSVSVAWALGFLEMLDVLMLDVEVLYVTKHIWWCGARCFLA
jgi:hypothetical protein